MSKYGLVQTAAPAAEPLDRNVVKQWLRIDTPDEDALVDQLITNARAFVEGWTALQLITATYVLTMDSFPPFDMSVWLVRQPRPYLPQTRQFQGSGGGVIRLPRYPAQAVTRVQYQDPTSAVPAGVLLDMDLSLTVLDSTTRPPRFSPAYGQIWPVTRWQVGAVRVTFTAGFGASGSAVPPPLIQAMLFLVTLWYENRGDGQQRVFSQEMGLRECLMQEWGGEVV